MSQGDKVRRCATIMDGDRHEFLQADGSWGRCGGPGYCRECNRDAGRAEALTIEDAAGWHLRQNEHYNGGREWFGYGFDCIEQPRLHKTEKSWRKTRSTTIHWSVDGEDCADLAEAVDRLNSPPMLTAAERDALESLPDNPMDRKEAWQGEYTMLYSLRRKGCIDHNGRNISRSDLARELLGASPAILPAVDGS